MQVIQATKSHKNNVLELLDAFLDDVYSNFYTDQQRVSASVDAKDSVFDAVLDSNDAAIFLAEQMGVCVGVATVYAIPQIRKARYCAEIEEMYVVPEYRGKGVAEHLVDAVVAWARQKGMKEVRLESGARLKRAHAFYEKIGFELTGRAYRILVD